MAENDGRNYTTNLEMVLPKQSEQYNVDDFNGNFQKIDDFAGQIPSRALVADELKTARKINGVDFKGNQDITIPTVNLSGDQTVGGVKTFSETIQGNIANATKAIQDRNGDVIDETYMKTADLTDQIYQSKAKESGNVSFDKTILDDIIKYKYSSFDRSKFTIVGSPNITDDGVASGFSDSNYINTGVTLSVLKNKSWTIKVPMIYLGNTSNENQPLLAFGNVWAEDGCITYRTDLKQWVFRARTGAGSDLSNGGTKISQNSQQTIPNSSICEVSFNKTTGTYSMSVDGAFINSWTATTENKEISQINNNDADYIYIAHSKQSGVYANATDLKQFSITVDGVEVFSGNKTGIDTIKPDDYTVVGTPTISADGIASGFSGSNYLTKALGYVPSTATIKIKMRLNLPSEPSSQDILFTAANQINGAFYTRIRIFQLNNQWIFQLYAYDGSTSGNCSIYNWTSLLGKTVDIYAEISNTYRKFTITDGESSYSQNSNVVLNWGDNSNWQIEIGRYSSSFFEGSIDLNAFKIYVNGNLTYQPCLKIPYTESSSKYGSKIVNAIYRDRVYDAYEQGYPQKYYTLDEDNGNFTLPCGEIYGMIENGDTNNKNLIDSLTALPHIIQYETTSSRTYILFSNGLCVQFGRTASVTAGSTSTTSNVAIESYGNSNYNVYSTISNLTAISGSWAVYSNNYANDSFDLVIDPVNIQGNRTATIDWLTIGMKS